MKSAGNVTDYTIQFTARVKRLRIAKGWTQAQMATALNISEERYRKYEGRSPMPHAMLERFSLITGRTLHYLITGHEPAPSAPPEVRMLRHAQGGGRAK